MRLLNVTTFQLETFYSDVPEYAALSHTWGDEEVTFQDLTANLGREKKGRNKILGSTSQAKNYSCNYVWIDTCCIDKSSSAELSEAINSMFRCNYTDDYRDRSGLEHATITLPAISFLHNSRWFKRGWTPQELIAPKKVYFYDSSWAEIGEKGQLEKVISKVTGINSDVLSDYRSLYTKSIAQRMYWASDRETTRTEDIAYCLLGIFDVNMPLLYGEGEKAFIRLQEAIMQSSYDHSLFGWNQHFPDDRYGSILTRQDQGILGLGLLAPHPVAFVESANIIPHTTRTEPYSITNRGLSIHLRLLKHNPPKLPHVHFAILQCSYTNTFDTAIAIPVHQMSTAKVPDSEDEFYRSLDGDFIEVEYSQAAPLKTQNVYFLTAGPLFGSKVSDAFHRCWLRNYGEDLGIRFYKARSREYPIVAARSCSWDYTSMSMTWKKKWRGSRAAIYCSKKNGPAFVVVLTFRSLSDQGGQIGMYIHIKSVIDCIKDVEREVHRQVVLDQILVETSDCEDGFQFAEAQKTFPFEHQVLTVRLKKEMVFDEDLFILDFLFSGMKRVNSETTLERCQKRIKWYPTKYGEEMNSND